jgi:hypothetical protein
MKEAPPRAENHENAKHFWNKKTSFEHKKIFAAVILQV